MDDSADRYFSVERRSDQVEVVRGVHLALDAPRPAVHYQILDDLISKVLLSDLLEAEFRGKLDAVDYKSVGEG